MFIIIKDVHPFIGLYPIPKFTVSLSTEPIFKPIYFVCTVVKKIITIIALQFCLKSVASGTEGIVIYRIVI